MRKIILTLIVAGLLVGCTTNQHDENIQKAYYEAVKKKAEVVKPTLRITCESGCTAELTLPDESVVQRAKTNTEVSGDVTKAAIGPVTGVVSGAVDAVAVGYIAKTIAENAGSNNVNTRSTTSVVGDSNSTSATTSMATNDSVDNSDNSNIDRHDTVDNRVDDNSVVDSHDQTATPTIVKPEVIIVGEEE